MRRVGKALRWTLLGLGAVLVILIGWGLAEPRFLDVERITATVPRLPVGWRGRRVALITDPQLGIPLANVATLREAVSRAVEADVSLALLGGDFVYHPGDEAEELIDEAVAAFEPLVAAGIPTLAVLGNPDHAQAHPDGAPDEELAGRVRKALDAEDIEVLENAAVSLPPPGGGEAGAAVLHLVGIGASWAGHARPRETLAAVPEDAPRLVLMHNPNAFARCPEGTAPLALAGHTHGGQVRLPWTPHWSWLTFVREDDVHADGWIRDYGEPGNQLYVSRGIGMSALPIRVGCRPELTIVTLGG